MEKVLDITGMHYNPYTHQYEKMVLRWPITADRCRYGKLMVAVWGFIDYRKLEKSTVQIILPNKKSIPLKLLTEKKIIRRYLEKYPSIASDEQYKKFYDFLCVILNGGWIEGINTLELLKYVEQDMLPTNMDGNDTIIDHFSSSKNEVLAIIKEVFTDKVTTHITAEAVESRFTNDKDNVIEKLFDHLSPWQNEILTIVKEGFADKIITNITMETGKVESRFTDFQAFCVCNGNKVKRVLYEKFIKEIHTEQDRVEAHRYAMQMYSKLEKEKLGFMLSLPSGCIESEAFLELFTKLENGGYEAIPFDETIKNSGSIQYSFYQKDGIEYKQYIRMLTREGKELFIINKEGKVFISSNEGKDGKNKGVTNALIAVYQYITNK